MFVPPWLRVAYIGVTTFVWLNVLCYIKSLPITAAGGKGEVVRS